MAATEADIAAQLIERLLGDPAFRAEFRRDPASACRNAGLDSLADEMSLGAGKAMMTLDVRESKSSLAGVMMAAAMEGVGVYQFGENVLPHLDDVPGAVSDVLSRVNLPAVGSLPGRGELAGSPATADAAPAGTANGADAANGAAPAAAAPAAPVVPPEQAGADGKAEKAGEAAEKAPAEENGKGKAPVVPPEQAAAAEIAAAEDPQTKVKEAAQEAAAEIAEDAEDIPSPSDFPETGVAPKEVEEVGPGAGKPAEPAAKAPQAPAGAAQPAPAVAAPGEAAPPAAVEAPAAAVEAPAGGARKPIDPDQFGGEGTGTGGPPDPEALALLKNKNIILDDVGVADIKAGRIDPRVVAVLTKLSQEHEIKVSCMCSDHSKFTSGGSVSNHFYGRGLDIAAVDGEIVNSGSVLAREIAMELQDLDPAYRPNEIGTPWPISGPGYFTDAGHQDHLHVGFKEAINPNWKPPTDVAAGSAPATAPTAGAAAAAPGQPAAAAAAPVRKPGDSSSFVAVTAEKAAEAREFKKGDSMAFMAVKGPAGPANALAPPDAVPAAVADAAAATASGASSLGAAALETAKGEFARGVREAGNNTGLDVDKYLKEAGVAPGNPWCASFVTWALAQNGKKMDGGGWAAVQTWVRAAEAGTNDLQVVSADEARPGDIVAYDWGGQEDFAADGHIGFLASNVQGGKFTALEGNYQDAVLKVPRQTGGANVKFLRIGGDAPPAAAPAPAAPSGAVVTDGAARGGGAADVAAAAASGPTGGSNEYPGDDAPKEQLAAWLGREAEKRGLPPQLPVMASLVESGVQNLKGGHADSVGFFQMRVGIWNQGEYAGYPDKPELQAKWFLDQAEAVKKSRIAAGKPVDDPSAFGEWIADVERPAEEYRGRYQLQLDEANALLEKGGLSAPAAAATAPAPAGQSAVASAADARDAAEARKGDSAQFVAVKAKAAGKHHSTVQFMKAIDPKAAKAAAGAGPAPAAAAAAGAAAPASTPATDDASMVQAVGAPVPANELSVMDVGPVGSYPGDNASKAELAKWLASEAKKAGLPPELPVMASLVESGVKNLKGGDADSAGFFQMRVGIWDQGPYKGYRQDPRLQAKWFIDNALAVKKKAIAAGNVNFGKDPSRWGEWIADVERPAAQYRYKYQTRLAEARGLLR